MRVSILVEFEVESVEGEELTENQAKDAADLARHHFLTFCTVSGYNTDTDEVTVHVDGFGECRVRLTEGD